MKKEKKAKKPLRTIYYHDCEEMKCRVLKDCKESCQFCGKNKWRVYLHIYEKEKKKPSLLEKFLNKLIGEADGYETTRRRKKPKHIFG